MMDDEQGRRGVVDARMLVVGNRSTDSLSQHIHPSPSPSFLHPLLPLPPSLLPLPLPLYLPTVFFPCYLATHTLTPTPTQTRLLERLLGEKERDRRKGKGRAEG